MRAIRKASIIFPERAAELPGPSGIATENYTANVRSVPWETRGLNFRRKQVPDTSISATSSPKTCLPVNVFSGEHQTARIIVGLSKTSCCELSHLHVPQPESECGEVVSFKAGLCVSSSLVCDSTGHN